MSYDFNYVGRELDRMLHDGKPMAFFCRAIKENIDEFSGQDFNSYVRSGLIKKDVFYINSDRGRAIYTVFTRPEERWRFFIFKELKKSSITGWSAEKEFLESWLLGYIK